MCIYIYIYRLYTYTLYQPLYQPLDGLGPEILPKGRSDQDSPWNQTQFTRRQSPAPKNGHPEMSCGIINV